MPVTLEQARALDALARAGTFAKAAAELHKGHTAVVYALRSLEEQTGLVLLDRGGYRTRLTAAGLRVLEHCRRLLAEERALEATCTEIKSGWEPELRVVFDGIYPAEPLVSGVAAVAAAGASTRVAVTSAFLSGVEEEFVRSDATVMLTLLPVQTPGLTRLKLPPLRALLVAHRDHPLASAAGPLAAADLSPHVLLTVRGSDPRLSLSTAGVDVPRAVHLGDFTAKKAAILAGLGYGWLPEHLIRAELRKGLVRRVPFGRGVHTFEVRLAARPAPRLGRAAHIFLQPLRGRARE